MEKEIITSVKLIASKGMVLTNGEAYGTIIYLGINDDADNWHEITDEEYEEIQKAEIEELGGITNG